MAKAKSIAKKNSDINSRKQWYVVYCKPNTEKKTAERLSELGIKVYCPLKTEVRQWSDRKKKVQVPVLPSMILVNIKDKNRPEVFKVSSAVRYLYWLKKPAVVSPEEVDALKEALSADYSSVSVETMRKGEAIKLKGLGFDEEEAVLKYVTKTHFCVYLERLGFMVKVKR
jgi:transcription antitermination factor NusG